MEKAMKKIPFCSGCRQLQGYKRYMYLITLLVGWGRKDERTSQLTNVDWKMITIRMCCGRLGYSQMQTQVCFTVQRTAFCLLPSHLSSLTTPLPLRRHDSYQSKHALRHSCGCNNRWSTPLPQWRSLFPRAPHPFFLFIPRSTQASKWQHTTAIEPISNTH